MDHLQTNLERTAVAACVSSSIMGVVVTATAPAGVIVSVAVAEAAGISVDFKRSSDLKSHLMPRRIIAAQNGTK